MRSVRNRSILDVCEDFEHERNAENTRLGDFLLAEDIELAQAGIAA